MLITEESVTNYFSYVKKVLGVKTIHSSRIHQKPSCDLLFLNLRQTSDQSIFAPESAELLDKMIQAMRLGERRHLILEHVLVDGVKSATPILQLYAKKITTPFVVLFSTSPAHNAIQSFSTFKFLESYSPSYLLQNPQAKKIAWADLQKAMKEIGVS